VSKKQTCEKVRMETCPRDVESVICNFVGVAGRNWNAEH